MHEVVTLAYLRLEIFKLGLHMDGTVVMWLTLDIHKKRFNSRVIYINAPNIVLLLQFTP